MSATKRLLFDRNPLDDAARERMRKQTSSYLSEFPHRIAMKRRGSSGGYENMSDLTSLKTFVTSFAGYIAAEAARA